MTKPIEAVLAEAQQRLESSGELNAAALIATYPEHAAELSELLPIMVAVHREGRWRAAAENSRAFGVALFAQLSAPAGAEAGGEYTVADLLAEERARAGFSLEEQARRSGLPVQAMERLSQSRTPVSDLGDNLALKQLAEQATAPFGALVKAVRRLLSLRSLDTMNTGAVFTRDSQTSTEAERKALLDKVRESTRKPPEED